VPTELRHADNREFAALSGEVFLGEGLTRQRRQRDATRSVTPHRKRASHRAYFMSSFLVSLAVGIFTSVMWIESLFG
jgi:hypothetical protein